MLHKIVLVFQLKIKKVDIEALNEALNVDIVLIQTTKCIIMNSQDFN